MHELQQLHKKHLLPQFSFEDSSDLTQQIEIKTAEITRVEQNISFWKILYIDFLSIFCRAIKIHSLKLRMLGKLLKERFLNKKNKK